MFNESLGILTRDHCQRHLADYLALVASQYDDKLALVMPKSFEVSTVVGGVAGIAGRETMPALAISAGPKEVDQSQSEDLYTFFYSGQLIGMVSADNSGDVEKIARRYSAALEMFIREHLYVPFDDGVDVDTLPYRVIEFGFLRSTPMGAAAVQDEAGRVKLWLDGFRIEIYWKVSEYGPGQHG